MEECVRRNEAEGKEINPITCTFVKKCKTGEVRNEKGRCVKAKTKTKQNTPNVVPFAPFVYRRKPYAKQKNVTINSQRAKIIKGNATHNKNHYRTTGKPGRKTYTAKLLPPHNVNTAVRGRTTVRNSRNLSYLNTMRLPIDELGEENVTALKNLEQELGESEETNMRPLQVRKRAELKMKAEELAKKGTPINERKPPKKRSSKSEERAKTEEKKALGTSLNEPNTEL